ncbi:hypothetical protein AWB71_02572 [Caballeronia peredens]|nr:hypothetical protein AWB71_02572 [Caballeronia peredens]
MTKENCGTEEQTFMIAVDESAPSLSPIYVSATSQDEAQSIVNAIVALYNTHKELTIP